MLKIKLKISPWMSSSEIEIILKYLKKDYVMLEYGCGGSTNLFPNYVKSYYSIEHNLSWFNKVNSNKRSNVNIFHVERNAVTSNRIPSLDRKSRYNDFYDYVHYPEKLGIKFDAVLIDGRARPECARFIKPYLNNGAYIFIHDYWKRKPYHVVKGMYKLIDSVKSGQSIAVFKHDQSF